MIFIVRMAWKELLELVQFVRKPQMPSSGPGHEEGMAAAIRLMRGQ